jgi:uncharacterized membrane protein YsdA (DUF1294 family)
LTGKWPPTLDWLWGYLILVNIGSFSLMGLDKLRAKMETERIPELWFVLCSLVGGLCGIVLGMLTFHHKISKRSFQLKVGAASVPAILALLYFLR